MTRPTSIFRNFTKTAAVCIPLLVALSGCAGGIGSIPGASLFARIPGVGLLAGVANGPLGNLFTVAGDLLQPPPTPLENEVTGPIIPTANSKFVVTADLPTPINGQVLTKLDSEPSFSTLGPDGRIYFTERTTGRVRVFDPNTATLLPNIILDLPVNSSGTRGLIGIAFSSDGKKMFLTYDTSTTSDDTNTEPEAFDARLVSYPFSNGNVTGGETIIFSTEPRDPQFASDINGIGPCIVAPDGFLYFSHGDRNSRLTALDLGASQASGKIFRYNQDGTPAAGNPVPDSGIFAAGVRNCTGMAVDKANGLFWFLDESSGVSDELNLLAWGQSYGWPLVQGVANTQFESGIAQLLPFIYHDPIIDLGQGKVGPRGIAVNRNGPYGPDMEGDVFFGQSASVPSIIWRYHITSDFIINMSDAFEIPEESGGVRDVVAGPDGRIYAFSFTEIFVLNPAPAAP